MNDGYLGALLAGLNDQFKVSDNIAKITGMTGQTDSFSPLNAVLASAWGQNGGAAFSVNRLSPKNFLPEGIASEKEAEIKLDRVGFEKEFELINALTGVGNRSTRFALYFLLQAFGSRIAVDGSSPNNDISLFDRNRLFAAVTSCVSHPEFDGKFLFVKGAVSGIQRFIYHQIQAEQIGEAAKVSKRLRGRSFFVTILGDILAEFLIEKLDLEQANILFVGGGHFNLLLPWSANLEEKLSGIIQKTNMQILDQFHLQLGLVHGMVPFSGDQLQDFKDIFSMASEKLESAKQKRFAGYPKDSIFNISISRKKDERDQLEEMGQDIAHAAFLIEVSGNETFRNEFAEQLAGRKKKRLILKAVEKDFYLAGKSGNRLDWADLKEWCAAALPVAKSKGLSLKIIRLNDTEFLPPAEFFSSFSGFDIGFGFRFIGQYTARYGSDEGPDKGQGSIMWFEDMAALDNNRGKLSYPQLAALRLDVDDLGALFRFGLGEKHTLGRTLSLSRELQLFFSGHLNQLAEKFHSYVVYSGGDDAFIIGSWYNILQFARNLRKDFSILTGQNPEVGLSAGIFTCHPKYPVARLGADAGDQESRAKNFKKNGIVVKDAIQVFEHTLDWKRFDEMMDFAENLGAHVSASENKGIRRSLLQHLLQVIQSANKGREMELRQGELALDGDRKLEPDEFDDFEFYRNIGRLHALIQRRSFHGDPDDPATPAGITQQLLKDMSDYERFADYLLPLQFVLYKTRS